MNRTRFAPSPTGELHLGHVYAAKVARETAEDGRFLLRHEDIDSSRVREVYYGKIEDDLKWLGIHWQGRPLRQTHRFPAYAAALETLKEQQFVYPCFCTRKEISAILTAPHKDRLSTYPGTCRHLSPEEAKLRIETGEPYSWRLDSAKAAQSHGILSFHDVVLGDFTVDPSVNGDAILARKDIGTAYHLAVVVDDAFQNITHVTRGEDLHSSTHIHRQLQAILGYPEPTYLHHELICDEHGKRLAKRDAARSIQSLRQKGFTASQVLEMACP
ncbi:MAG: tRNA glutamyl-Q(34) synthetase GluQRS [Luteolibacter sp.]